MSQKLGDIATGVFLGIACFILLTSSVPLEVRAETFEGYFFTMTFLVPTSNPTRQQQAAIIAENLRRINIDVRLVYMTFGLFADHTFGCDSPFLSGPANCGKTWDQGGYDAGIIGLGGGTTLPDFGSQNFLSYRSLTNSDYSPTGANFIFYHNDSYNQLAAQYNTDYNATDRTLLAQKMVRIILQDRPDMPIWESTDQYDISNAILQWGSASGETAATTNRDFQHWSVSQGDSINVAEQGNIASVNQWSDGASNIYYDAYLYNPTMAPLEELDGRTLQYFKALATSIVSSPDHHTWTVIFRPHNFQDGVSVTSDDYLFSMMGSVINDVGYVGAGTFQGLLGDYGSTNPCECSGIQFTYLNGTSDYVLNGTYSHKVAPAGWHRTSLWTAVNSTAFSFTLSDLYLFADPVFTGISAQPMHIFERIPFSLWGTSPFATLHMTSFVYNYNLPGQADHGGNGSGTAYGPIGDGAYFYHGYDNASGVGTLVKWEGYWNATGLESIGEFNAKYLHVMSIPFDQGLSAFQSGKANFLDSNYYLPYDNLTAVVQAGGRVTHRSSPWGGFRIFFLQLTHPAWGTGTATPNGQKDPAHAIRYARYVRDAISHAIPRQDIVDYFYHGLLNPGISEFCTCFSWAYPPGTQPDSYNLTLSLSLLAMAGYSTSQNVYDIDLPSPLTVSCGVTLPAPGNVTLPTFTQGGAFTMSGSFAIPVSVGGGTGGFYTTLEESTDNGTSWQPVALTISTEGGYYTLAYSPTISGNVWYRAYLTGIPASSGIGNTGPNTPGAVESYVLPQTKITGESPLNITDTQYGPVTQLQIQSLAGIFQAVIGSQSSRDAKLIHSSVCSISMSVNASLASLGASITSQVQNYSATSLSKADLTTGLNQVNSRLASASYIAYGALAGSLIIGASTIAISWPRRRRH